MSGDALHSHYKEHGWAVTGAVISERLLDAVRAVAGEGYSLFWYENDQDFVRVHRYIGRGTSDAKMYAILYQGKPCAAALTELLSRDPRAEHD
jgi:hypothetical protein